MLKLEPARGAPTRWDADPDKVALLIAGGAYAPARPLLHYLRKVLLAHGWTVQELWWQPPVPFESADAARHWVLRQVADALAAEVAGRKILCGKSLASLAIPLAQEQSLPALWLTPILTDVANIDALQQTSAPTLLIGGDADDLWDGEVARRSGHTVLELPGQDHGLEVDDPLAALNTLRQVVVAADTFLSSLRSPP
jgi:pimeloyl-ACP methyl ester carboxylesterase